MLARAINALCLGGGGGTQAEAHPPGNVCYRGGGFDDKYRDFFCRGRAFRQPSYLATSFEQSIAEEFLGRATAEPPARVLWRIHIDPVQKCRHVNLVCKRVPDLPDEREYLFAPYSAFRVRAVAWRAGTAEQPHIIDLEAAVDNIGPSEDLPLAPWA